MTSASEGLRALGDEMYWDAEMRQHVREALPLVADVVEAAEALTLQIEEECQNERSYKLDDALTALRDALEEK